MNTGRLYAASLAYLDAFEKSDIINIWDQLIDAVKLQVNTPASSHIDQIIHLKNEIKTNLKDTISAKLPGTWKSLSDKLKMDYFAYDNLCKKLDRLTDENQIKLSEELKELEKLFKWLKDDIDAFKQIKDAFEYLGIETDQLQSGECELSILVPRQVSGDDLGRLSKELCELNQIIAVFSEIATGETPESPRIRQISTSDPTFYLLISPPIILFILKCLNMILDAYEKVVKIRKIKKEAEVIQIKQDTILKLEEEAKEEIDLAISKAVENAEEKYLKEARKGGRDKELLAALRIVLEKLSSRVDHGYRIEAYINMDIEKEAENNEGQTSDQKELESQIQELKKYAEKTKYFEMQGEPILNLPKPGEEVTKPEKTDAA